MALKAERADVAIAKSCRVNAGAPVPGVTNVARRVALAPGRSPIGGWWVVQVWRLLPLRMEVQYRSRAT